MIGNLLNRNKGGDKPVAAPAAAPASSSGNSTQAWLPIRDIYNGFIHRRDGAIIAAVRVFPTNLNLLSDNEKFRKIKSLEEVLNGIDYSYQIISIARPVDLDAYIASLDEMKNNAPDRIKARLLAGYIQNASLMATSGEALERQFYILIDQMVGKRPDQDEAVLFRKASDLAQNLSAADLASHVCNDDELRDLLFIFTNPNQAAFERAPITQSILPSVFIRQEV